MRTSSLLDRYSAHIFFQSVVSLFIFLMVIFQRADFHFDEVRLSMFSFVVSVFGIFFFDYKIFATSRHKGFSLVFNSVSFISFSFYLRANDPFQINFYV